MMRRVVIPELLDSDAGTPEEVQASLDDLRWFNRYFGGHRTTASLVERIARVSGKRELTWLDVGGASGETAIAVAPLMARRDVAVRTLVLDRKSSHLPRNGLRHFGVSGDAVALPFRDESFDVVGSSLLIHHFDPQEVRRALSEALRVARIAAFINDLRRSALHRLFATAGTPLYRSRLTRHDAPASVRRAYTADELLDIVKQVKCSRIEMTTHYFYRIGVILWR